MRSNSFFKPMIKEVYNPNEQSTIKDIIALLDKKKETLGSFYNWYIEREDDVDILHLTWFEKEQLFQLNLNYYKEWY